MIRYTVRCEFTGNDEKVVERWLQWLRDPHIADVMEGGATGAEVVRIRADRPIYEIRYQFASDEDFEHYQHQHAPRLKAEGLKRFPPDELGLVYSRTVGEVVHDHFR